MSTWQITQVPPEVESLELEAGGALVEEHVAATILFMRTVSGALAACRQVYEGTIANDKAMRREWSIHGYCLLPRVRYCCC